jgi:hypothetical protein
MKRFIERTSGRTVAGPEVFQSSCENLFQMLNVPRASSPFRRNRDRSRRRGANDFRYLGERSPGALLMVLKQLVFEVVQQDDGGWTAVGIGDDIFTEGSDFEDLKVNTIEAVRAHFFNEEADKFEIRLAQVVSQFVFAA